MATDSQTKDSKSIWIEESETHYLKRCIISGKWCSREKEIKEYWEKRIKQDNNGKTQGRPTAFVIMPFGTVYDHIFEGQIRPMLTNLDDNLTVSRADTVMRTGNVLCKKICRQILEADLIVAEMTEPNANVLYELGLAAGLKRNILILVRDLNGKLPEQMAEVFRALSVKKGHYLAYKPFKLLMQNAHSLHKYLWKSENEGDDDSLQSPSKVGIIAGNHPLSYHYERAFRREEANISPYQFTSDLECLLGNCLRDAICEKMRYLTEEEYERHLAERAKREKDNKGCQPYDERYTPEKIEERHDFLAKFTEWIRRNEMDEENACQAKGPDEESSSKYLEDKKIRECKKYFPWMHIKSRRSDQDDFWDIVRLVRKCQCLVVDITTDGTDKNNIVNYFWIGYAHGENKWVIPITDYNPESERPKFDVRELYYVSYDFRHHGKTRQEFQALFQYILKDEEDKREKKEFWKPFLDDVNVTFLVGASNQGTDFAAARYGVGEWDYLTIAELVNFFNEQKPTLSTEIGLPIYARWRKSEAKEAKLDADPDWDKILREKIEDRNCIAIGSPDVNLFTELVLAKAKNIAPFGKHLKEDSPELNAYVAWKNEHWRGFTYPGSKEPFVFYYEGEAQQRNDGELPKGFTFYSNEMLSECDEYCRENETRQKSQQIRGSHGYLAMFKNPYSEKKWILVLSGVSGPATLSLAHILTGCKNNKTNMKDDWQKKLNSSIDGFLMDHKGLWEMDRYSGYKASGYSYDKLSEELVAELNRTREKLNNDEIEALFFMVLGEDPEDNGALRLRDKRRIIFWDIMRCQELNSRLSNPRPFQKAVAGFSPFPTTNSNSLSS
jgi:hypothetical protein